MPVEKILIHRKGQILGTEKIPCQICKKDTDQDVVYFFARPFSNILARLDETPDHTFIGYVCHECKSVSIPIKQTYLKKMYGWSNFRGFKGKPKKNIEFKENKYPRGWALGPKEEFSPEKQIVINSVVKKMTQDYFQKLKNHEIELPKNPRPLTKRSILKDLFHIKLK